MLELSYTNLKSLNLPMSYIVLSHMTNVYCVLDRKIFYSVIFSPEDLADFQTNYLSSATQILREDDLIYTYGIYQQYTPAFSLHKSNITIYNGLSLFSIFNPTYKALSIKRIYIVNTGISPSTGGFTSFEIRRCGGHSGGTDLSSTVETYDTLDVLDSNITIRTGATIINPSSNTLKSTIFATTNLQEDSLTPQTHQNSMQLFFPLHEHRGDVKPITLRHNEGITVNCVGDNIGIFDVKILLTQL